MFLQVFHFTFVIAVLHFHGYLEAVAQRCSVRKGVPRNFGKFTGKHLCQSLFFNKVVGLRPATLLKKRLWHRCFPMNFPKFLRTPFLTEHLRWLLLAISLTKYDFLCLCFDL